MVQNFLYVCVYIYHVLIAMQYALNLLETYVGTWYTAHKDVFFSYCVLHGHVYTVITFFNMYIIIHSVLGNITRLSAALALVPVAHVPIRPTDS